MYVEKFNLLSLFILIYIYLKKSKNPHFLVDFQRSTYYIFRIFPFLTNFDEGAKITNYEYPSDFSDMKTYVTYSFVCASVNTSLCL